VAGADYPRTYPEFRDWFPDEPSCVDYLAGLRWPQGFVCPACCAEEYWRTGKGLWMCRACGRKTSVTAGTIFRRSKYGSPAGSVGRFTRLDGRVGVGSSRRG